MFIRFITSVILILSSFSTLAAPTPYRVPDSILTTFENFPASVWQSATTTPLGTVYLLKSDARATTASWDPSTVHEKLGYALYMSGMSLGKRNILNVNYQRIDELGSSSRNQCVAQGKSMTGASSTSTWIKGTSLKTLYPNGKAPTQLEAMALLPPGTMIANFDGSTSYPNRPTSHVVLVRGVNADNNGYVLSIDVYGQNGVSQVILNGSTVNVGDPKTGNGGTMMKYTMPWSNANSTVGSFSAKNYHIVNKPWFIPKHIFFIISSYFENSSPRHLVGFFIKTTKTKKS